MGKASTKENKNRYFQTREELGLTRAEASELLEVISEDRVEKIENERIAPQPYDVLAMARAYKKPSLCNYYCSHECPIGQEYVPEVEVKELSSIVLEMLASLNSVQKQKDRLIEIAADGKITGDEIEDFIHIQPRSLSRRCFQLLQSKTQPSNRQDDFEVTILHSLH